MILTGRDSNRGEAAAAAINAEAEAYCASSPSCPDVYEAQFHGARSSDDDAEWMCSGCNKIGSAVFWQADLASLTSVTDFVTRVTKWLHSVEESVGVDELPYDMRNGHKLDGIVCNAGKFFYPFPPTPPPRPHRHLGTFESYVAYRAASCNNSGCLAPCRVPLGSVIRELPYL